MKHKFTPRHRASLWPRRIKVAVFSAVLATVGMIGVHTPAEASTEADCLTAHPGAVSEQGVTDGDDLVCADSSVVGSPGDDTYLWVPENEATDTLSVPDSDAGYDTLSLADWQSPWIDQWDGQISVNSLFGDRILGGLWVPEQIRMTDHADFIGNLWIDGTCGTSANSDITWQFGAGDDNVLCITGDIFTGTGADTVRDGGWGSTVTTDGGDDTVIAGAGTDTLNLGAGADTARVKKGDADVVNAGAGADVAYASPNDTVSSAVRR